MSKRYRYSSHLKVVKKGKIVKPKMADDGRPSCILYLLCILLVVLGLYTMIQNIGSL